MDNVYIKSAKRKRVKDWDMVNISFKISDLTPNENGWVNLTCGARKQPDKDGNTHYLREHNFKPAQQSTRPENIKTGDLPVEDLPF